MKILVAHNKYRARGGEDAVAEAEAQLLRDNGHDVHLYERSNRELNQMSMTEKTRHMWYLAWSQQSYRDMKDTLERIRPDVVHFHNIYFMMSPAVYYACQEAGVPVVQSLHNFRPLCANGLFFRDNQVCEKCLHGSLNHGIRYRCYQNSLLISALVVRMLKSHRKMKTWQTQVNAYITATEFTRQKYIQAGFNGGRIYVKPNFIYPAPEHTGEERGYALYIGRLSDEKGLEVLIKSWVNQSELPLRIAGEGPLLAYLSGFKHNKGITNVSLLGRVNDEQYHELMSGATCLIVPSVCYENFPRIAAEAMAYGLPVIASRLGSLEEIIDDGVNGGLFEPGNPEALKERIDWLMQEADRPRMRQASRQAYEERFNSQRNLEMLLDIYQQTINGHKSKS